MPVSCTGSAHSLSLWRCGNPDDGGSLPVAPLARYSVLVIGGGLALINGIQMLFTAIWLFVPMPVAPTVDASQAHTTLAATKIVFAVLALIYAVLCAVGISWLVYFNLKWVREVLRARRARLLRVPAHSRSPCWPC